MALEANDTGKFYPDQAAVDNDTPIPCRILAISGGTASVATVTDPPIAYGPPVAPFVWSANSTPVIVGAFGAPVAYSVTETDADASNAASAASAGANAALAEDLALGLLRPLGLSSGYSADGWTYAPDTGIWSRRFANDSLFFTEGVYGAGAGGVSAVYVLVQDFADVNGRMSTEVAFWGRTTGSKVKTTPVLGQSDGSGTIQNIEHLIPASPDPSALPGPASELTVKITTGAANAPVLNPYRVLQIYTVPV